MDVHTTLHRIHDLLENHPGESAAWIGSVIELGVSDDAGFYRELNSKRMWGGAALLPMKRWRTTRAGTSGSGARKWEFRELMIELGSQLQARDNVYPDISSWLLAFSNWNQSEV